MSKVDFLDEEVEEIYLEPDEPIEFLARAYDDMPHDLSDEERIQFMDTLGRLIKYYKYSADYQNNEEKN